MAFLFALKQTFKSSMYTPWNVSIILRMEKYFSKHKKYDLSTGNMRQLVVDRRICCCSQFMIFLFELLGPAKQPMACPSSSNRKIMNWEQQQILLSTTNCLILPVIHTYVCYINSAYKLYNKKYLINTSKTWGNIRNIIFHYMPTFEFS